MWCPKMNNPNLLWSKMNLNSCIIVEIEEVKGMRKEKRMISSY